MDNFRKRQARRADEAITAERERLLNLFLPAVDNLERALAQPQETNDALRQGVELTHREIMRRLEGEGVTRLETVGQPFDPELHEAVATILSQAEAGTIVKELEAGYKLGDKLLRPARVIVAA
jgi:molecular chaperone GrpE